MDTSGLLLEKKGRTFLPLRYELNKEMILSRREGSKREYSPDG